MARYDELKIPVSWLPESIQDEDWWDDGVSIWQTKDLNNEYDLYIFNESRQMFMFDYVYDLEEAPNRVFGIVMVPRFVGRIKQNFDDSLICYSKPNTKLYKIKVKILGGVLESIKILGIKDYKTEI